MGGGAPPAQDCPGAVGQPSSALWAGAENPQSNVMAVDELAFSFFCSAAFAKPIENKYLKNPMLGLRIKADTGSSKPHVIGLDLTVLSCLFGKTNLSLN